MPRRLRWWVDHAVYHITYRCHEREFLFKFGKYRDLYVRYLREVTHRYGIDVLDYMVTANHIHLLISASEAGRISEGLQYLHSRMAQKYNFQRKREGAFWKDRFHATRVQDGEHFGRCMFYIDLNMVRVGAVRHSSEWEHTAYHEFVGTRQRYRVVNIKRLLQVANIADEGKFRKWYAKTLATKLSGTITGREPYWSEAIAVGDAEWLNRTAEDSGLKRYIMDEENGIRFIKGRNLGRILKVES